MVTHAPNLSLSAKREALARIRGRYQRAGRPHQTRLDEFCATGGYPRKAARRLLNRPLPTAPPKRPGPKRTYDPVAVLPGLKAIGRVSDPWCSKLLQAALPEWLAHHPRRSAPLPEVPFSLLRSPGLSMPRRNQEAIFPLRLPAHPLRKTAESRCLVCEA